jgi:hypothetical protein
MKVDENELDRKFDDGRESILENFDLSNAKRVNLQQTQVELSMPLWMIEALDREASRLGIDRQAVIKSWLAGKLEERQFN